MILLTTNKKKFKGCGSLLDSLGIELVVPDKPLMEPQGDSLVEVAVGKARMAAIQVGHEVLVDDAGLELLSWPGFPGPMTGFVLKTLGKAGLERLLDGNKEAEMVCVLAWSDGNRIRYWTGRSRGFVDVTITVNPGGPGPLASWFVSDDVGLAHRRRALEAFGREMS